MRLRLLTVVLTWTCAWGAASAEPFAGAGEATRTETKQGTIDLARKRALARARAAALGAALEQVSSTVDPKARRAVETSSEAWTGAYRVVSESVEGDAVRVELEVDIDLARLAKRVMPKPTAGGAPLYRFGRLAGASGCQSRVADRMQSELVAVGALGPDGAPVTFELQCRPLGPVPHTFVFATRVEAVARDRDRELARASTTALGASVAAAEQDGLQRVIEALGVSLAGHRRGRVVVRVEDPLPSARIRRLERALEDAVVGVADADVIGLGAHGSVLLAVHGELSAPALARKLEALKLPSFSVTIVRVEGPDALTIRLQ